jgi:hypothetical protein
MVGGLTFGNAACIGRHFGGPDKLAGLELLNSLERRVAAEGNLLRESRPAERRSAHQCCYQLHNRSAM